MRLASEPHIIRRERETSLRSHGTARLLCALLVGLPALVARPAAAADVAVQCDYEADACVKYMVEELENKGWIGIELDYEEGRSPVITRVVPGSPAETAGLQAGDVLMAFDGVPYATASEKELKTVKKAMVPGKEARLTLGRDGEEIVVSVTLGNIPPALMAQWIGGHFLERHRHQFETAAAEDPE